MIFQKQWYPAHLTGEQYPGSMRGSDKRAQEMMNPPYFETHG